MAVGVPIYTGENAGGVLKQSTGERVSQAQEKMSDRILDAEKFKYTERKREETEFLKNAYIKPEYLISAKARTDMAKGLQEFNQRWTKTLKDNKGILPFDLKVQMQNEKALLESTQNDLLEQMGQWKMMNDAVLRDNGVNYDKDEWDQVTAKFLETGRIDITQPPLKSINPYLYFQDNPAMGTASYDAATNKSYSASAQESGVHIGASILSKPRLMQGVIKDFRDNATQEEKIRFLDVNKDRVVSPAEAENSNAILEWAKEKYSKWAIKETPYKPTKARVTTTAPTTPPSRVGGANLKIEAGIQTPREPKLFSDQEYSQTQSFRFGGNAVITNVPTRNGKALNADWTEEEIAKGIVDARLVLYDPTKRVFLVKSTAASESADQKSQTLFEIPESNILDFENIPIEYVGNKMTIGRYREIMSEGTSTEPSKGTAIEWGKYKR